MECFIHDGDGPRAGRNLHIHDIERSRGESVRSIVAEVCAGCAANGARGVAERASRRLSRAAVEQGDRVATIVVVRGVGQVAEGDGASREVRDDLTKLGLGSARCAETLKIAIVGRAGARE